MSRPRFRPMPGSTAPLAQPGRDTDFRRINTYKCERCGRSITVEEVAAGTTPMFLRCRATAFCTGRMTSQMYRGPHGAPTWRFRRPTKNEIRAESAEMRHHYRLGGLLLERITPEATHA